MGRLLFVELRRALARGVTRFLPLVGVGLIIVIGVVAFVFVETPAERQAKYETQVAECEQYSAGPNVERGLDCAEMLAPIVERAGFGLAQLWPGWDPDRQYTSGYLGDLLQSILILPAFVLLIGGIGAGASMVGADWQAGSFVTLLTWEPRRRRLLAARLLASALLGTVITVVLLALFTAALVPTAIKAAGPDPGTAWWFTYAGTVARLGALTGVAAAVGGALAMIGRRTALAVFAVFAELLILELTVALLRPGLSSWLLLRNLALVLGGQDLVTDGGTTLQGIAVLSAWSVAIIAIAMVVFGRRDFASSG
jgi:ABC-2 type transport system permease protein